MIGETRDGLTGTKGKIKQRHGHATLFSIFHAILTDFLVGPNERFILTPRPKLLSLTRISNSHPLTLLGLNHQKTIRKSILLTKKGPHNSIFAIQFDEARPGQVQIYLSKSAKVFRNEILTPG